MTSTANPLFAALETKALSEFTSEEMSEARELALRILRADYYQDVRNIANDAKDAVERTEPRQGRA